MLRVSTFSLATILCLSHLLNATSLTDGSEIPRAALDRAGSMPSQCQPGKTSAAALGWRWKAGTRVRIEYQQDSFTPVEVAALTRAVDGWNAALVETDSHVVFIVSENEALHRAGASILVQRGTPRGPERVGELRFHSVFKGSLRLSLTISPVVTDLDALTSLMTHEIGHSLGLADCYECRRGTTAMAAFKAKNKGNDVYRPSECDRFVVAAGYGGRTDTASGFTRTTDAGASRASN